MPRITATASLFILAVVILVAFSYTGCSTRHLMVNGFVDLVEIGMPVFEQEDDLVLLADAMPAHIKLLETMLANDPANPKLLVLMSRLYGAYAFAVLETEWVRQKYLPTLPGPADQTMLQLENRLSRYFDKGIHSALRALEVRHPGAEKQLSHPRRAAEFLQTVDHSDVPAIFWYGFNLVFFVQHHLDSIEVLANAHLVEKTMQRVLTLDPGYYYGSAHVILMAYYASRSPMMGGNPKLAAEHYRQHKQQWAYVAGLREMYWARYYLVQQQERDHFTEVLNELRTASTEDRHPLRLLERVAAVRAAVYLKATDRLFDGL